MEDFVKFMNDSGQVMLVRVGAITKVLSEEGNAVLFLNNGEKPTLLCIPYEDAIEKIYSAIDGSFSEELVGDIAGDIVDYIEDRLKANGVLSL